MAKSTPDFAYAPLAPPTRSGGPASAALLGGGRPSYKRAGHTGKCTWRSTTPSSRTATPRTSRSRRRCSRSFSASASPGTSAGRCASSATTPSLSATPQLWPSIEQALGQSRFLILLASPEAAASPWVGKEIASWLEHKSVETLLVALTDGTLIWDNAAGDFEWSPATPLPSVLRGRFGGRAQMGRSQRLPRRRRGARCEVHASSPPTSQPPSAAFRRRICSPRRCASSAAR